MKTLAATEEVLPRRTDLLASNYLLAILSKFIT